MKQTNLTEKTDSALSVTLTDAQRSEFIRSMKIGYYRVFYKQGLITAEQLEQLIAMQNAVSNDPDNKTPA